MFVRPTGGTWATATQTKLTADDGATSDQLGYSVAVSGDTIVAGARFDDVATNNAQGSAYVFVRPTGGTWATATQTKLTADDGAADDQLGLSVAVPGDTIVAGAPSDDVAGNINQGSASVFASDDDPPRVSCAPADGQWHGANVSITCTATDTGSGLANGSPASFALQTNVAADSEDANASTDSREVCDAVANCATAGPVTGNKVDRKQPGVTCDPADGQWHGANVSIACTATDTGSGLASVPPHSRCRPASPRARRTPTRAPTSARSATPSATARPPGP